MTLNKTAVLDVKAFGHALATAAPGDKTGALALFRDALRAGRTALRQSYSDGEDSIALLGLHAWLVDQLLMHAWSWHTAQLPP